MAYNSISYSNKALNFKSFKKLFEDIQTVENVDETKICISFTEKNKNLKKRYDEEFNSIPELLECVRKLKKIDSIEVDFLYKKSIIKLKYDVYDYCWILDYNEENNVTNAIRFILQKHFNTNFIKNFIFQKTFILWLIFWGISLITLLLIESEKLTSNIGKIAAIIVFSILALLIVLDIYKILRRTKPYINNKFWEEHKIEIVQNIIFFVLGVITPYVISGIAHLFK